MRDAGFEDEEGREEAAGENGATSQPAVPPVPALTRELEEGLRRRTDEYQAQGLARRYTNHNTYKHFRAILHDARHPDSGVVDNPSRWFADAGGPEPGVTNTGGADDDDDDLGIVRANISTKCPITCMEIAEPVTSARCHHTYEKAEIENMIKGSGKCPVCGAPLALGDLKEDAVIIRKIRRLQRAEEAKRAAGQEDEDEDGGTSSRFGKGKGKGKGKGRRFVEDIESSGSEDQIGAANSGKLRKGREEIEDVDDV